MLVHLLGRKQVPGRLQSFARRFRECALNNIHEGAMTTNKVITQVVMTDVWNQNGRLNCSVEVWLRFQRLVEFIAVYAMDHKHYWKYKWKFEHVPNEISEPKSKEGRGVSSEQNSFESAISSFIMRKLVFHKTKDLLENPKWYVQHILQDCNAFSVKNLRFS